MARELPHPVCTNHNIKAYVFGTDHAPAHFHVSNRKVWTVRVVIEQANISSASTPKTAPRPRSENRSKRTACNTSTSCAEPGEQSMAPSDSSQSDPTIDAVAATTGLAINVTWGAGPRAGITEEIDLGPVLEAMKYFRSLREDPALFATVHPILDGIAIAWGDDEDIDLSADAILRLAGEQMTGEDMRAFIERQGLTETALAAMLGYSRRQIVGFLNENRPIPRVVALACRYIEMMNPVSDDHDGPHARSARRPRERAASRGEAA
jgi:hypothetical protein